jgi:hypothetical protein
MCVEKMSLNTRLTTHILVLTEEESLQTKAKKAKIDKEVVKPEYEVLKKVEEEDVVWKAGSVTYLVWPGDEDTPPQKRVCSLVGHKPPPRGCNFGVFHRVGDTKRVNLDADKAVLVLPLHVLVLLCFYYCSKKKICL